MAVLICVASKKNDTPEVAVKFPRSIRRRWVALIAVSLGLGLLAGCVRTTPLENEPLTWSPSDSLSLGVRQNFGPPATVRFVPFEDTAENPHLIGRNVEHPTVNHITTPSGRVVPIPRQVTTSDDVGPFVSQHLQDLFGQAGYAAGGKDAKRVITGVVHKFFVVEGSLYKATLNLSLTVSNSDGKVLWTGTVIGTSSTFGGSYRLDNYEQVLSNSILDAADQLLHDPGFSKVLALPAK